ncbi:MAG: hybrid sensor histidine kinase/response regulator [Candidatus Cloacimonetes bacterium]|nr:hybrid sensor histidine kinase/response regulator [Candidatus Cloacimonadota bacterium]
MKVKSKILIVDDKIENLIALETLLQDFDVDFIRALSGKEAIKQISRYDFALIIMDVQMPEMDGFETVRIIKKDKKNKLIPIIFVSAIYSQNYYNIKGVEAGGIDFITKPLITNVLIGKVRIFLDMHNYKVKLENEIELRKKVQNELLENREHLKLLNKILRHDILNNLSVVISALRLYKANHDESVLEKSKKSIEKSVELINRMRGIEMAISSRKGLKPIDLNKAINKIIAAKPDVEFSVKGKAQVLADQTISSIFDNIISNAVIHGKADKINITINRKQKKCEIRIADNGQGIPDNIKESVFEEGFHFGKTGGTGIGLYIVKKTIEKYGGKIFIEDNKPNGTIIVVFLQNIG